MSDFFCREISHDYFANTKKAKEIQASLKTHSELWKDKSTSDTCLLNQLDKLLKAIENEDYIEILKIYYVTQHRHTFDAEDRLCYVPVYICPELNEKWVKHVKNAIESISIATPGLCLFTTQQSHDSKIDIGVSSNGKAHEAFTVGSIYDSNNETGAKHCKSFIHLGHKWDTEKMKGTSLHELMHALGFLHEFQRFDVDMYLNVEGNETSRRIDEYKFLTRFDPFSVMMYSESRGIIRREGDPIWQQKPTGERHQELSELNKVALNLRFKPCKNTYEQVNYNPKIDENMEMLYCGRKVMLTHNEDGKSSTDGECGPNNLANCASCRVILWIKENSIERRVIPTLKRCLDEGKWQGLSGLFYCGKPNPNSSYWFSFSGITRCGPDTGNPCDDCKTMLNNCK